MEYDGIPDVKEVISELKAELTDSRKEADSLRLFIAKSDLPCIYCGLPKADMGKCASGFPGCGRADDLVLHVYEREAH